MPKFFGPYPNNPWYAAKKHFLRNVDMSAGSNFNRNDPDNKPYNNLNLYY